MCYMTVEAELFGGTKAKENRFGGGIGGDIFNIMHTLKKNIYISLETLIYRRACVCTLIPRTFREKGTE